MTIDDLFALPSAEFVAARDALARAEAKAGRKEDAKAIRALKRPTRPAEILNGLARTSRRDVERLLAAADALRAGLEKGDRKRIDTARRDAADALDVLQAAARGAGASEQVLNDVTVSLQAAAADPESGERLLEGRLERPLETPGFAALAGLTLAAPKREKGAPKPPPKPSAEEVAARKRAEQRERLERRVAGAREEVERATAQLRDAEAALAEFEES